MDKDAVNAARKKLLARFPERCGDGREYARPGDQDLWLSATGARIERIIPFDDGSVDIGFTFGQAQGFCRLADGERRELPEGLPWYGCGFPAPPPERGNGWFSGTLWALWTWMTGDAPLDIYAALGKWTLILAPETPYRRGLVRSVAFPTITEPDSPLAIPRAPGTLPLQPLDEETLHRWIDDNSAVMVGLYVFNDDEAGTAYSRQWVLPKARANDFAGMMTHRFGEPLEVMLDAAAAAGHADEIMLAVGNPGPFGFSEDDGKG